jgi:hypothetical protein
MTDSSGSAAAGRPPLAALRRFVRPAPPVERCELCSAALAEEHAHLVEPAERRLLCACEACAILFSGQGRTKYRRMPRRVLALPDFRLGDAAWEGLGIPIGLAFFFHSTPAGKTVAVYPSPAGPTESQLDLGAWADLAEDNPALKHMEPDTEALLVNRVGDARTYYLVPIDQCYKLVGAIRLHWRGFSGGSALWHEVGRFFEELARRARPAGGPQRA